MSKSIATLALASLAGGVLLCAATPGAKKPVHKSAATTHHSSAATHKTTARKKPATTKSRQTATTAHRSTRRYKSTSRGRTVVRHSYLHTGPQAPTADRYKEIQQALAERGYYHGEVNGAWGQESTDALKRFQTDQHLDADGKLDSLSLIGLGLGPKRTLSAQAAKPQAEEP